MKPTEARNLINRMVLALDDRTIVGVAKAHVAAVERTTALGADLQAVQVADELVAYLERHYVTDSGPGGILQSLIGNYRAIRPR